jgi:hypothetical protein
VNRPSLRACFSIEVEDHVTPDAASQPLHAVTDWGRYTEALSYDDQT